MLPSSLDEVESDVVTSVSRASNGDQTLRLLYKIQGAARQAAQEVEAKLDITLAPNRRCGKDPENMNTQTGDSVYVWKKIWRKRL